MSLTLHGDVLFVILYSFLHFCQHNVNEWICFFSLADIFLNVTEEIVTDLKTSNTAWSFYYCPQTKGEVMFSHVFVCPQLVGRILPAHNAMG